MMQKQTIAYNSAYLSMNLLDELDFCFGGYGKPNIEFIFSLNTFVESFIGSSEFYTSLDELNHLNLTAPAIFPNGRPILNLVVREGGLKFVNGVIEAPKREIYRGDMSQCTKREAQQDFIINHGVNIREKYFQRSNIDIAFDSLTFIAASFEDDDFVVSEIKSRSEALVSNLVGVANTSSIQTTLPMYLYNKQVASITRVPYSIQSLRRVAKIYDAQLSHLQDSLGYRFLPIPPFANILLSQVNSVSEVPSKLSQLRADFQQLRVQFIELEKEIFESHNMRQQKDAYRKFIEFWGAFNRKYEGEHSRMFYNYLDLGADADFDKAADNLFDGGNLIESAGELNTGKILGNAAAKIYRWGKDRRVISRFKGLTNIWDLFGNSKSLTQQLAHFERLFSVRFSNDEINRVHEYVKQEMVDPRNKQ